MKLTIFGATGRTGRHLVEQALESGHEATAFVRDPKKMQTSHQRLTLVEGDVLDAARVEEAVEGADAVLSAIGHTKTSTKDVQTEGIKNIISAMEKYGVKRLVSLTGAGVTDPRDQPKLLDKAIGALLKLLQRDVLEDAEGHARLIQESDLDWVIVRAPMMNEGDRKGSYRVGYVGRDSGSRVSRADVADFMLKQVKEEAYLHQAPMVSY